MPDGSPGLSLSEIGVSTIKKTAQAIKKIADPVSKQVKQQIGGSLSPGQSVQLPTSMPPSESIQQPGGFDLDSLLGEKNGSSPQSRQVASQQMNDPQAAIYEQQKAKEQQQIEILRKKLHDIYFEDFKNKTEGKDSARQEKQQMQMQQEDEDTKQQQKEEGLGEIQLTQGPQKGGGKKKKNGFNLMKLIKPKQGSHEGKASKG